MLACSCSCKTTKRGLPTASSVPRRSPIQVLTRLNTAWLQWSDENWYVQCDVAVGWGVEPQRKALNGVASQNVFGQHQKMWPKLAGGRYHWRHLKQLREACRGSASYCEDFFIFHQTQGPEEDKRGGCPSETLLNKTRKHKYETENQRNWSCALGHDEDSVACQKRVKVKQISFDWIDFLQIVALIFQKLPFLGDFRRFRELN